MLKEEVTIPDKKVEKNSEKINWKIQIQIKFKKKKLIKNEFFHKRINLKNDISQSQIEFS